MRTSWTEKIVSGLVVVVVTAALLAGIDYLAGRKLITLVNAQKSTRNSEQKYRIADPVFHHALAPSFKGQGSWADYTYAICTDSFGFKISCLQPPSDEKKFDIAFIGDSFTEGTGLTYEESFVGQIAAKIRPLKVANLGVASYSPSIYLTKVKKLLDDGFLFKELVVYVDISDIQDEAVNYQLENGVVRDKLSVEKDVPPPVGTVQKIKKWVRDNLPLTYVGFHALNHWNEKEVPKPKPAGYLDRNFQRGGWTYNPEMKGYGDMGVDGAIKQSVEMMTQLYDLLAQRGIKLSVGVYPWPVQILYDSENSRQVQIWRDFCKWRCSNFYNSFPIFFAMKMKYGADETIKKFFIPGDVHHTPEGAKLIAEDYLRSRCAQMTATSRVKGGSSAQDQGRTCDTLVLID